MRQRAILLGLVLVSQVYLAKVLTCVSGKSAGTPWMPDVAANLLYVIRNKLASSTVTLVGQAHMHEHCELAIIGSSGQVTSWL